ncbi:MAG: Gfo/Idh/MocA family oxidoreductase [Acidobacteriota bacterium]|nr:Gfo/Idh/MocA family oxidoreductase [Acidobacteriota bacterium]
MSNFALIGAAGFVAPRHMKAIKETGHSLVAALDPSDSIGIIDSYFPGSDFFTEFERFDRHIEKLRREKSDSRVDYVSIASPNYLHDAHIRFALRVGADAICEKPLVLNPWNIDALRALESEFNRRVYTILQLRLHPAIRALRDRIAAAPPASPLEVELTQVSPRGRWYAYSWKGQEAKSGGIITNIGIHFFDMLLWIFGPAAGFEIVERMPDRAAGLLHLRHANVRWTLSLRFQDLPASCAAGGKAFRRLTVGGKAIEFEAGFADLHTACYAEILAGRGFGLDEALPSVDLAYRLRTEKMGVRS